MKTSFFWRMLNGASRAIPIVMGYIPIGFAYGVLAKKAGLSTFNTLGMSIFVYAGSSQLIGVGLFTAGTPALSIILTTFVVNLRHLLMASALAPYLKGWGKLPLSVFAYEITDESFAIHSLTFPKQPPDKVESIALNMTAQISWVMGTLLGVVAGGLISDVRPFALDYALPAMFIALLVLQTKELVQVAVALLSGLFAVLLLLAGLNQWYVIIATVIGASLGVLMEKWIKLTSS
jgi:4-azaleucine resistance transporter AzlC